MMNYPMTTTEASVVRWTGRILTALAFGTIVLFGAISFTAG